VKKLHVFFFRIYSGGSAYFDDVRYLAEKSAKQAKDLLQTFGAKCKQHGVCGHFSYMQYIRWCKQGSKTVESWITGSFFNSFTDEKFTKVVRFIARDLYIRRVLAADDYLSNMPVTGESHVCHAWGKRPFSRWVPDLPRHYANVLLWYSPWNWRRDNRLQKKAD